MCIRDSPDTAAAQELLSGKRHATGMEFNLAGRLTPKWELFFNHTWIPSAKIDKSNVVLASNGGGAQVQGDRPGLTPKHSGSVWSTYACLLYTSCCLARARPAVWSTRSTSTRC